jgi:large conductance mechanosensitive channel
LNETVSINIGNFIQSVVDFLIISAAIFAMVKIMNRLKQQEEEKPAEPAKISNEEALLSEIRDLLKEKR